MEKKMENEMETLGPFKGVYRDYRVVYRDQGSFYTSCCLKGCRVVQFGTFTKTYFRTGVWIYCLIP